MKIKKLNESMLPSQATLEDCLQDYLNNAFGYDGVKSYVDTQYPMHPQEFKAAVCDYLKNHINESLQEAWQVGDQVTIKWNEPNFEPYAYATCEYQGKTEDGKHKFKSTTYGWDFIVDLENKKIKTPHDKEYDLWDESGWTKDVVKEDIGADDEVIIGLYGDEVSGFDSVDQLTQYFEDNNIKVISKSGDMEYGWDLEVKGNARDIYRLVNGKITGYNCNSTQEFVDRYRIDESKSIKITPDSKNKEIDIEDKSKVGDIGHPIKQGLGDPIKESSYKKGDRVELDNGMTGTVTKDFDWEKEDQVSVEIDGTGEMRYPRSEMLKDLKESVDDSMIYLFPELTDEDLEMAKGYGLKYLGKNHGADGGEDNWVLRGAESSLRMFADKYLGYELHPDYLYDEEDFAGEIINESLMGLELDKDDILDWLAEHEQAWADAERHFGDSPMEFAMTSDADSPLEEVSVKDLVEWIADHKQLYDDFHRFFYEDNLDEEFLNFDFNQNPDDDVDGIIQ